MCRGSVRKKPIPRGNVPCGCLLGDRYPFQSRRRGILGALQGKGPKQRKEVIDWRFSRKLSMTSWVRYIVPSTGRLPDIPLIYSHLLYQCIQPGAHGMTPLPGEILGCLALSGVSTTSQTRGGGGILSDHKLFTSLLLCM